MSSTADKSSVPILDHIVILIPYSFLTSPPSWFSSLFTFYPGGRHADGVTENTLVLFADGSYLEFIAFVPGQDPAKRETHKWGRKQEGTIIDWAFTLPGDWATAAFAEVQKRVESAGTGIGYPHLIAGGRHRPDGHEMRWVVSPPSLNDQENAIEPGLLPFWCLDETPRGVRVPYKVDPKFVQHPTGALGIASVTVRPADKSLVESVDRVYGALLGKSSSDGQWAAGTLTAVHPQSHVRRGPITSRLELELELYTDSTEFEGKTVGGKVTDQESLQIQLSSAK